MEVKVNALMLRAVDYNENDKIITLLTAENGKISAAAKGVKKAGAKLKFAVQPFCFAEYVLAKRGDRYTVTGCTEIESFYDLRTDILKFYAASAAAEAALALTCEGEACPDIFFPLVNTLAAIGSGDGSSALIAFLFGALGKTGYGINLGGCPYCGKRLNGVGNLRFDMPSGSFACEECSTGARASLVTYNVLKRAAGEKFDPSGITPDGEKRALRLLREFFLYKTDTRLTALSEYIRML